MTAWVSQRAKAGRLAGSLRHVTPPGTECTVLQVLWRRTKRHQTISVMHRQYTCTISVWQYTAPHAPR